MYNYAIRSQYAYINPCIGLTIPKAKQKVVEAIPTQYIPYINEFCKTYRHGAFIMTLLYTGVRRGEIAALKWGDVNIFANCININKAMEFVNNIPNIKAPKTKSGTRSIPILSALLPYIKKPHNDTLDDFVFKNKSGNPHTETSLKRLFDSFNKEFNEYMMENYDGYEKEHFTMHRFRHPYVKLKTKILCRCQYIFFCAEILYFPHNLNTIIGIYIHFVNKHIC